MCSHQEKNYHKYPFVFLVRNKDLCGGIYRTKVGIQIIFTQVNHFLDDDDDDDYDNTDL